MDSVKFRQNFENLKTDLHIRSQIALNQGFHR